MHSSNDNLDSLGAEDQLISLRGQINEIKEYIDLLMRQSAIIRERRCLLEDQQDVKPPAIMEQLDFTPPETSSVNLPDIKSTQDSAVSGPSLALNGTADCHSVSSPRSESIETVLSDNTIVVQPPTRSQGSTSKPVAIPRRYNPGRRKFQGKSARHEPHEPPALYQGWADASGWIF